MVEQAEEVEKVVRWVGKVGGKAIDKVGGQGRLLRCAGKVCW